MSSRIGLLLLLVSGATRAAPPAWVELFASPAQRELAAATLADHAGEASADRAWRRLLQAAACLGWSLSEPPDAPAALPRLEPRAVAPMALVEFVRQGELAVGLERLPEVWRVAGGEAAAGLNLPEARRWLADRPSLARLRQELRAGDVAAALSVRPANCPPELEAELAAAWLSRATGWPIRLELPTTAGESLSLGAINLGAEPVVLHVAAGGLAGPTSRRDTVLAAGERRTIALPWRSLADDEVRWTIALIAGERRVELLDVTLPVHRSPPEPSVDLWRLHDSGAPDEPPLLGRLSPRRRGLIRATDTRGQPLKPLGEPLGEPGPWLALGFAPTSAGELVQLDPNRDHRLTKPGQILLPGDLPDNPEDDPPGSLALHLDTPLGPMLWASGGALDDALALARGRERARAPVWLLLAADHPVACRQLAAAELARQTARGQILETVLEGRYRRSLTAERGHSFFGGRAPGPPPRPLESAEQEALTALLAALDQGWAERRQAARLLARLEALTGSEPELARLVAPAAWIDHPGGRYPAPGPESPDDGRPSSRVGP